MAQQGRHRHKSAAVTNAGHGPSAAVALGLYNHSHPCGNAGATALVSGHRPKLAVWKQASPDGALTTCSVDPGPLHKGSSDGVSRVRLHEHWIIGMKVARLTAIRAKERTLLSAVSIIEW
jgi:hypothetical protein